MNKYNNPTLSTSDPEKTYIIQLYTYTKTQNRVNKNDDKKSILSMSMSIKRLTSGSPKSECCLFCVTGWNLELLNSFFTMQVANDTSLIN